MPFPSPETSAQTRAHTHWDIFHILRNSFDKTINFESLSHILYNWFEMSPNIDMSESQTLCSANPTLGSANISSSLPCRAAQHAESIVKKVFEEAENAENRMRKALTDAWHVSVKNNLVYCSKLPSLFLLFLFSDYSNLTLPWSVINFDDNHWFPIINSFINTICSMNLRINKFFNIARKKY